MKTFEIAKAIVDSYEENGFDTSGKSFYDLMYILHGTEAWDMVVKVMSKEVISRILAK